MPLGMFDDADYEQGEVAVRARGDALLLYSDGITEALDVRGAGVRRGARCGRCGARAAPQRRRARDRRACSPAVEAFRGRALQSDDMTLVVVGAPRPEA